MSRKKTESPKEHNASQHVRSPASSPAVASLSDERRAAWPIRAPDAGRDLAIACARVLDEDKCEDVVILDVRGISPICDFFVIATGTSDRQMRATADHVDAMAKDLGEKPYRRSGPDEADWIVVDYVDVVVHLFAGELRGYYDLESLWGDGQRVEWAGPAVTS